MRRKFRIPFSNLKFENIQNLVLVTLFIFYMTQFGLNVVGDKYLQGYGVDYLAFWSAGKIADDKGYAEIYDLENLRITQTREIEALGLQEKGEEVNYSPFPFPYFSFFVLPFQLLAKVNSKLSYWIWTSLNLVALIGYLIFFLRLTQPGKSPPISQKPILFLMLLSFPIIVNLVEGQLEIFMLICMGEFIRNALKKKAILSGMWLGGLLLKPQLLIIIIPIFIIFQNWKVLLGFIASFGVIVGSSILLSGLKGTKLQFLLWTQFSTGINPASATERMINWRMIAANLDSTLGWVIAILGITLTSLAIYFLVKNKYIFGTPNWVMIMLGVFSATLAITWHSHYHMAVILIPFLIYCLLSKMLSEKIVFFWATTTPIIIIILMTISLIIFFLAKIEVNDFGTLLLGVSGFILNLLILISALKFLNIQTKSSKISNPENPSI